MFDTNSISDGVRIMEDTLKSIEGLSAAGQCCVAVYIVCFLLKRVLKKSKFEPWSDTIIPWSAVLSGVWLNYILWWTPLSTNLEVPPEVRNVWLTKLLYGGFYGFITWAVNELLLTPALKKLGFKKLTNGDTGTEPQG